LRAIEDEDGDLKPLLQRQRELGEQRRELERKLPLVDMAIVALHPNAHQRYRRRIDELQTVLASGDAAADGAMKLVRLLITRILVIPERDGMSPLSKVIWR
jgi:hypothetical protein